MRLAFFLAAALVLSACEQASNDVLSGEIQRSWALSKVFVQLDSSDASPVPHTYTFLRQTKTKLNLVKDGSPVEYTGAYKMTNDGRILQIDLNLLSHVHYDVIRLNDAELVLRQVNAAPNLKGGDYPPGTILEYKRQ